MHAFLINCISFFSYIIFRCCSCAGDTFIYVIAVEHEEEYMGDYDSPELSHCEVSLIIEVRLHTAAAANPSLSSSRASWRRQKMVVQRTNVLCSNAFTYIKKDKKRMS